jgi:hypothetical protein
MIEEKTIEKALLGAPQFLDFLKKEYDGRVDVGVVKLSNMCMEGKNTYPVLINGIIKIGEYNIWWDIDGTDRREYEGILPGHYGNQVVNLK